ncbi:hypothetical protein QBC34DRAFT_112281 [Podospora aff. communis PSN243]|uniref:Uncharacterized protein n=1 Tax=Podospora aff. communis PSN243 TaxID=3040156 RepID=A0AAV9GL49_9PEZI|nr:hypothetical protein QBC34DRAFT_112281 [Podospora aff. communis PSN243]
MTGWFFGGYGCYGLFIWDLHRVAFCLWFLVGGVGWKTHIVVVGAVTVEIGWGRDEHRLSGVQLACCWIQGLGLVCCLASFVQMIADMVDRYLDTLDTREWPTKRNALFGPYSCPFRSLSAPIRSSIKCD